MGFLGLHISLTFTPFFVSYFLCLYVIHKKKEPLNGVDLNMGRIARYTMLIALAHLILLGHKLAEIPSEKKLSLVYFQIDNYEKAREYYSQSLKMREKQKLQQPIVASLNNIGLIYSKQKQYPEALEYLHEYSILNEEIFSAAASQRVADLQTAVEIEKNEMELKALKQENELRRLQNRIQIKELGHKKNPKQMDQIVHHLSNIYRQILYPNETLLVPLKDEITVIQDYLEIENRRLEGKLDYNISVEKQLMNVQVLPLTIESPFVPNPPGPIGRGSH